MPPPAAHSASKVSGASLRFALRTAALRAAAGIEQPPRSRSGTPISASGCHLAARHGAPFRAAPVPDLEQVPEHPQSTPLSSVCHHWRRAVVAPIGLVSLLLAHAAAGSSNGERRRPNLNTIESVCGMTPDACAHHDRPQRLRIQRDILSYRGRIQGPRLTFEELLCMSSSIGVGMRSGRGN
jgi:hypothetical protein